MRWAPGCIGRRALFRGERMKLLVQIAKASALVIVGSYVAGAVANTVGIGPEDGFGMDDVLVSSIVGTTVVVGMKVLK